VIAVFRLHVLVYNLICLGGCCTNNPCTSAMNALPWLGLAAIPPSALFVRRLHLFGAPGATGGLGGLYVTAQLNLNNLSRLWPVLCPVSTT
jgi:hypothetical protein